MWRNEECVKCTSLRISAKSRLYVINNGIVATALYGAETWNMGATERERFNIPELRCLRSICGVSRTDRVQNE